MPFFCCLQQCVMFNTKQIKKLEARMDEIEKINVEIKARLSSIERLLYIILTALIAVLVKELFMR